MKQIKIFSFSTLLIVALSISSCRKFLEEKPESFTNAGTFYQTKPKAQATVNACYLKLSNIYTSGIMSATEYTSDLAYLNNGGVAQTFGMSPSNPGMGSFGGVQNFIGRIKILSH